MMKHIPGFRTLSGPSPWYVLCEFSGLPIKDTAEALLGQAIEDDIVTDAAIAASDAQREFLWKLREIDVGIRKEGRAVFEARRFRSG